MLQGESLRYTLLGLTLLAALIGGCSDDDEAVSHVPKQITTKTGLEMMLIPGGEFIMGDNRGEDDEEPAHKVKISVFYTKSPYLVKINNLPMNFLKGIEFENMINP